MNNWDSFSKSEDSEAPDTVCSLLTFFPVTPREHVSNLITDAHPNAQKHISYISKYFLKKSC